MHGCKSDRSSGKVAGSGKRWRDGEMEMERWIGGEEKGEGFNTGLLKQY